MFAFVVAVGGKSLAKELVRQNACLGESPYGFLHLEVNKASDNFVRQVVLFDCPGGKEVNGHFHVLISIESSREVKVANV